MKLIQLTNNKQAIVDDDDYDRVSKFKWYFNSGYAGRTVNGKQVNKKRQSPKVIKMQHFILGIIADRKNPVDHINGDKLDNRKSNLRICSEKDNSRNKRGWTNRPKGVYPCKKGYGYFAAICVDRKQIYLGYYKEQKDAAKAYNEAAEFYFGEYACLN